MTNYWFGEQGTSEGPEWFKIDFKWVKMNHMIIQDQFSTIKNLQRAPIPQTSN